MRMMYIILIVVISIPVNAKTYFKHPEHGKVNVKSEVFQSEKAKCNVIAFGEGIELSDRTLKNTKDVSSYIAEHSIKQMKIHKRPEDWEPREKEEETNLALKNSHQCMLDKGWKKV